MMKLICAGVLLCHLSAYASLSAQERRVIVPVNAAKPVGPYSPGIDVGDYLYVSGQGVRDASGAMPNGIEAQTRQCLENVKAIVEAAGLTMEHVVHMQLYLEKMSDLAVVDRVYQTYFPQAPPARIIIGVAKMPTETTVELTAVAVRDRQMKKVITLSTLKPIGHASSAVAVGERIYLSGVFGASAAAADRNLRRALAEAKLGNASIVWQNKYSTAAPTSIPVNELPLGMKSAVSVVALRGRYAAQNQSEVCVAADAQTLFCSVQAGASSAEKTVAAQVQAAMKNLQAGLGRHGVDLNHVTASNVYLDDIKEFKLMNDTYAAFFAVAPPTRTTVQPFRSTATANRGDQPLARISVVAVKR